MSFLGLTRVISFARPLARLLSLSKGDEERSFAFPFPKHSYQFSHMRSSGSGGQNVNRRNTKAALKVQVTGAKWISDRTIASITESNLLDKSGCLTITCQGSRQQSENSAECLVNLESLLHKHSYVSPEPTAEELAQREKQAAKRKERRKQIERTKKYLRKRDFDW